MKTKMQLLSRTEIEATVAKMHPAMPEDWHRKVVDGVIQMNVNRPFERNVERFLELSLKMERHSRGLDFRDAMTTFPSADFHEWCDLAKSLEGCKLAFHVTEPQGEKSA